MKSFKVSFEIDVSAETPLEAAKIVQNYLQDPDEDWQFFVQDEQTDEIFSVDLGETDDDAVLPVDNYVPFINPKN
jgi:hypothetical protein